MRTCPVRRLALALLVLIVAALLIGDVAYAQTPPEPVRMEPPPQSWVEAMVAEAAERIWRQVLLTVVEPFADLYRTLVEDAILIQTPARWTYTHPLTLQFHGAVRAIVTGATALVLLVAAVNVPLRRRLVGDDGGPGQALTRVLVALAAVWTCLPPWGGGWIGWLIEAINAVVRALPAPGDGLGPLMAPLLRPAALLTGEGWLAALLVLLLGVGFVLYALVLAARLVFINVLLAAAPFFLLCWILPQTRGWSGPWARALVLALVLQPVQVLILGVAAGTLAPAADGPGREVLAPLVGLATLYLLIKAPELLGVTFTRATSPSGLVAATLRLARLARGRR